MNPLSWLRRRSRPNPHLEADLREELQFHLKQESQLGIDRGLSEQDARRAAHRDLGNVTRIVEDTRAVWISTFLEQLLQDIRYALRTMRANALTTILAITSLALGIGANTAIYSFMDAILVRSLPVQNPESLTVVNWLATKPGRMELMRSMDGSAFRDEAGLTSGVFPYPAFELLRKISTNEFSHVFAHRPGRTLHLTVNGAAHIVKAEYVSGNFFQSLGIQPAFGRLLQEHDDQFSAPSVISVSHAFAERHFETSAAAGKTVLVNNVPFTITGVVPPGFHGVNPSTVPDIYLPLTTQAALDSVQLPSVVQGQFRDSHYYWLEIMARLKPGVTRQQAQARLGPQVAAWFESTAEKAEERANLPGLYLRDGARGLDTLRRQFSKPLYVLLTLVGLILALACANIANLLLARATARRKEFALRLSLGAGRMRLVRQLLTESLVLGFAGGILGVAVALWGMRFLTMLLANGDPNFTLRAELNWNVLAVATTLSLLTGVLFGLAPALQSTKTKEAAGVQPALKEHRHSTSRLSDVLIAAQIAISLLMLVAAGLFVRTLSNLQSVDVGFQSSNLLIFEINARQAGYDAAAAMNFYRDLRSRLTAVPGVRNATFSNRSVVRAGFSLGSRIPGNTAPWYPKNRMLIVGPDYFTTMGIPLLMGREILESDNTRGSIVVNEEFVKHNFDGKNPIGRHILVGRGAIETDMEIVGICKDIQYGGLKGAPPPVAFLSTYAKYQPDRAIFEVRTPGNSEPMQFANTIRELVRSIDARIPVTDLKSQSTEIEQTVMQEMVFARLCTGFAILGLLIACVGLYGTVAYNVARRTSEIGIRMALGASQSSVLAMVLRRVMILTTIGIAIGLPVALGTSRFVETFLFGMKPNDPAAIAAAVGILALAIVAASYIPARRAAKIDPMTALRYE